MKQYGFRHRILLLAVALVVATQLIVLFPVLDLIKRVSSAQADRTVGLAGVLFDEYMHNRAEQLQTTVNILVSDYPFKQAVASGGDEATIRSVLLNHASRVPDARVAALLDPDGRVVVSSTVDAQQVPGFPSVPFATLEEGTRYRVINIGGVPYQTVTAPLRAPVTIAWVMLGFPIDDALATHLQSLTELDVSFVSVAGASKRVLSSTLPDGLRSKAILGLDPARSDAQRTGVGQESRVSLMRPFAENSDDVYVALQLSESMATASYRRVRNFLFAITGVSLLLAVTGSFWLA
jgi:hypothetical protein